MRPWTRLLAAMGCLYRVFEIVDFSSLVCPEQPSISVLALWVWWRLVLTASSAGMWPRLRSDWSREGHVTQSVPLLGYSYWRWWGRAVFYKTGAAWGRRHVLGYGGSDWASASCKRKILIYSCAFPLHSGKSPWAQNDCGAFISYERVICEEKEGRKLAHALV